MASHNQRRKHMLGLVLLLIAVVVLLLLLRRCAARHVPEAAGKRGQGEVAVMPSEAEAGKRRTAPGASDEGATPRRKQGGADDEGLLKTKLGGGGGENPEVKGGGKGVDGDALPMKGAPGTGDLILEGGGAAVNGGTAADEMAGGGSEGKARPSKYLISKLEAALPQTAVGLTLESIDSGVRGDPARAAAGGVPQEDWALATFRRKDDPDLRLELNVRDAGVCNRALDPLHAQAKGAASPLVKSASPDGKIVQHVGWLGAWPADGQVWDDETKIFGCVKQRLEIMVRANKVPPLEVWHIARAIDMARLETLAVELPRAP